MAMPLLRGSPPAPSGTEGSGAKHRWPLLHQKGERKTPMREREVPNAIPIPNGSMNYWLVPLLLLVSWPAPNPAPAAWACRQIDGHEVCIVDLRRSAKNYWEYWAVVQVDGVMRSPELYNCRDRTRFQADGNGTPLASDGMGWFVCRLFKG